MDYCAVCCIAKDEDYYIEEWVNYHLLLGFDKIILYDNHSKVSLKQLLSDKISSGKVLVHETAGDALGEKAQSEAYTHCFKTYKNDFMWIAVIDADEIIMLKKTSNIKIFLDEFENYGGVFLNWVHYANPDMLARGSKSQIENFIYRYDKRTTTGKSIVRPERVKTFTGPHGPDYVYPFHAVNTEHFPLESGVYSAPCCTEAAQINHYRLRTKEDYLLKTAKWKASGLVLTSTFEEMAGHYHDPDDSAARLFARLQATPHTALPCAFSSVGEVTDFFLRAVATPSLRPHLQPWLCQCMCLFPEEPLIWLFRAMLARQDARPRQALHYIRQACKLSGSSTLYFELAAIYAALGDAERSVLAREQAVYKKSVEDRTCA